MSQNNFRMPAIDGAGLGVGAAETTRYRLCLIRTEARDVADFLTARELAGRVDHAMGVTSVVLADPHFRPLYWDEAIAAQLAAATGNTVELIGGELADKTTTAMGQSPMPQVGLTVTPDGAAQPMSADQLSAAAAAVPGGVASSDRWLVLGRVPGRTDLAMTIDAELPAGGGVQAHLWQEDGWFLAELVESDEVRAGVDPIGGNERPVLAASIAATLARRDPVVVVRHGATGTAVMQPGARRWSEFVLQWGLQRMWIHPRWGVAAVDQDNQVGAFAKEWGRAGGEVNEVNLRALSRRRVSPGQALQPVLECLSVPTPLVDQAAALSGGVTLSAPQVLSGGHAQRPARSALALRDLNVRGIALRGGYVLAAVAGCLIAYQLIGAGISGWNWAVLAGASLLSLAAVAGALGRGPIRACGQRPGAGTTENEATAPEIVIDLADAAAQQDQPQH